MAPALRPQQESAFSALQQFARKRKAVERCEMCGRELAPEHEHLVEPANRRLMCTCEACTILFEGRPAQGTNAFRGRCGSYEIFN